MKEVKNSGYDRWTAEESTFEEDVVDPSVCCMCFGTYEEDILGAGLTGYLVLVAA